MRHFVSIVVVLLVLMGSMHALSVTAQDSSLRDLLPAADDVGPEFVSVDNRSRTLAEQATGFSNADEAARLLADWSWQENAFVVFQAAALTPSGAPAATIDISLTRFADAAGAATAMPYFLQDRTAVLGQREVQNLNQRPIGDETRIVTGPVDGGEDTTIYVRSGVLLLRISATSRSGGPAVSPVEIARGILDRDAPQSPSSTVRQLATEAISDSLPLDYAACFRIDGEGALDLPAVVERLATGAETSAALQALGWQGGDYRQFACDPPPGGIGWVDISVHRFPDAAAAAEAVDFFAASRAQGMNLQPAAATELGEHSAALAGPAVNGQEYTLYTHNGPLLFAVTGVAPASTSDPRADVEAIAAALLAPVAPVQAPVQAEESPTPTPVVPVAIPPTMAPVSTATPLPTPIPVPTATPAPQPTATLAPLPAAIPTAIVVPTEPPPPPTAPPNPLPTAIPTTIPPQPTAMAGAQPSPTPRVIRPPTPVGE